MQAAEADVVLSQSEKEVVTRLPSVPSHPIRERAFFIDNLLVRIHLNMKMVLVDRPCAMGI